MPDNDPEVIEKQMQHTRASLSDKVAALESQVVGTIQSATSTVHDTVHAVQDSVASVKHAVEDTMHSVKHSVDESVHAVTDQVKSGFGIPDQVREHPWPFVGGAAAAGFITGLLVFSGSSRGVRNSQGALGYQPVADGPSRADEARGFYPSAPSSPPASYAYSAPAAARTPSWLDGLLAQAGAEVRKLGEEALGTAVAALRKSLEHNLKDGIPHLIDTGMERVKDAVSGTAGPGPDGRPAGGFGSA